MSIIHDALKKVQSKMGAVNPEDVVEVLPSENSSKKAEPEGSGLRTFLISVFCLLAIGASLYIGYIQIKKVRPDLLSNINLPFKLQKNVVNSIKESSLAKIVNPLLPNQGVAKPKPEAQEVPVASKAEPPVVDVQTKSPAIVSIAPLPSSVPATKPPDDTDFNIQGVMANPHGNVVLINGNVYAEGDSINGSKIVKITLQNVTVEQDGESKTIPVKK